MTRVESHFLVTPDSACDPFWVLSLTWAGLNTLKSREVWMFFVTGDILSSFDYSIYIFTLYIICNSISSINTFIDLYFFQLPSFSI